MVKRDAASQEALDRSPKRTQLIDLLSDSDSDLPTIDFSRLTARSQQVRESTQRNPANPRGSWLVKPKARCVGNEEDEEETEAEPGLELVSDQKDTGRHATVESDPGKLNDSANSKVRHDPSPSIVQSPNSGPASPTSDIRENFGDAEPSAILDHAIDPASSVSVRQTPAPAEAVATKSPTVGATDTYVTGLSHSRPTSDARDHPDDAGPSDIPNVATASISPSGPRIRPALQEASATNCSMEHETDSTASRSTGRTNDEPIISLQYSADECERRDGGLAPKRQGQKTRVDNGQQSSARCHKEVDDMDDVMLVVKGALNNMWYQLSKNCPSRTMEQWRRLYDEIVLPAFETNEVIASLAARRPGRLSSKKSTQKSNQVGQSTQANNHAMRDVANRRHRSSPVVGTPESQNGTHHSAQACIQGNMRFTNCEQVNVASNVAQPGYSLPSDGGVPFAPTALAGDLVFEGCKVVNILTPPGQIPSIQKRQRRSHRPRQNCPQPQSRSPEVSQHQGPSQHPPPAPHVVQPSWPNAPLWTFAQPYPPIQLPMQPQSYDSALQSHTHDPSASQAYHAGPNQAPTHTQYQHQLWPQTHFQIQPQIQAQRFHDLTRQVQQNAHPQAYLHPLQESFGVRHPAHEHETVYAHGDGRRWGTQAPEEYDEMEEDNEYEYASGGSEEYDDDDDLED